MKTQSFLPLVLFQGAYAVLESAGYLENRTEMGAEAAFCGCWLTSIIWRRALLPTEVVVPVGVHGELYSQLHVEEGSRWNLGCRRLTLETSGL